MSTCLVYTVNAGYLVPALVSAVGARANLRGDVADVVICDVGAASEVGRIAESISAEHGIFYQRVDAAYLEGLPVTYARLFMTAFLPAAYDSLVYLDADSQVWGDISELAEAEVPDGRILAVRDPITAMMAARNRYAQQHIAHLRMLELPAVAERDYFNAGVIKASRATWAAIGRQAVERLRATAITKYVDQDVLNFVALDRLTPISARWNYPGFLLGTQIEQRIGPRFVHYMSNPRPWHGAFPPWRARGEQPYTDLEAAYPSLKPYRPRLTPPRRLKYVLQQRYKAVVEGQLWEEARFRDSFLALDRDTAF